MSSESQPHFQGTERFGILRRVGAGGMGVVYEAYDRERQSLVALKTLRHVSPETILRFKQEFRSLAQVVHPNLVPLYELISDGKQWFFTMELLADANDLRTYLRGKAPSRPEDASSSPQEVGFDEDDTLGPGAADSDSIGAGGGIERAPAAAPSLGGLDLTRTRKAFGQLVEGVMALHEAGILHRDLKPENVLVRQDGRVILLDFGLVLKLGADSRITSRQSSSGGSTTSDPNSGEDDTTGDHIAGSVSYMAPEQAAMQSLSAASDWYAVGVILYEILTGRLPFRGDAREVLHDKQLVEPQPPRSLVADVPEDLNSLCMDLLNRAPEARPPGTKILARLRKEATPIEIKTPTSAPAMTVPFIGRKRQLEALSRCFEKTFSGSTAVCYVHGRSGAGKSTLVEHFLNDLADRDQIVILPGRCYEQESVPYKAVDSLLDVLVHHLLRLPPAELDGLLPDGAAALARLFPVLKRVRRIAELAAGDVGSRDLKELRSQAFTALGELLARLGERDPLVLFIDDLQWGDRDSAALLSDILCSADPPRLLMLFSYRTEYASVSPCLRALENLAAYAEAPLFQETIEVDALTEEETRTLALTLIGETPDAPGQADWVVEESGGSALFVYELVQHLKAGLERIESGAVHLDEVLWQRIVRLPDEPRLLLEVIAVASKPIHLRHVQEAARLPRLPPQVVGLLRSERLVRTTGPHLENDIESYHDRIRESIVAHLAPTVLSGHHAALAEALEKDEDTPPELLAVHLEGAGRQQRAGHFYRVAAEQATEALAFDRAEDFFQRALAFAAEDSVKAAILERLVHFYTDLARFEDAYRVGREGARLFGIRLPARFNPLSFLLDLVTARLRLGRRNVADILELPMMSDERRVGAVRLIAALAKAAYQVRPELCVAVNARMVNLCLKHGNTSDNAIGYMVFGAIFLGGILGKYQRGYEFGRLSLDLVEKYKNVQQKAEVHFVVGYFGTSWLRPATEAEALWRVAYSSGLDTGDLFHTGCACCATILSYFMRGVPISQIAEECEGYLELLHRIGLQEPAGAVLAVRQAIRCLQAKTEPRGSFDDADFDEADYIEKLANFGSRHFAHYYYVVKMQTAYLWGDYQSSLETVQAAKSYLKESAGMLHSAEHLFYHALILTALLASADAPRGRAWLRTIRRHHRRLRRWAAFCPHNFRHKERLIAAELTRLAGDRARAAQLYEEARQAAAQYGYRQIEALAHQLAARSEEDEDGRPAKAHRAAASGLYRRWGATGYADALDEGRL